MKISKNLVLIFFIILIFILICSMFLRKKYYLELRAENGKLYFKENIKLGTEFSIKFIHSVNKSPVIDYYKVKKDGIYVDKTLYYDFGAGVQTQLEENQKLEFTDDGAMLVSGFDKKITDLAYVVGKVSDHELTIGEKKYSLTKLCGKGAYVSFQLVGKWSLDYLDRR